MKELADSAWGRFLQVLYIGTYLVVFGAIGLFAYSDYNSVQTAKRQNKNIEIVKNQPGYEDFVKNIVSEDDHPVMSDLVQKIEVKYNLDLPYDFKPNIDTTFNIESYVIASSIAFATIEIITFVILYVLGIKAMTFFNILIKKDQP